MAMIRERKGRYQVTIKNKLLPKPYIATFDDEQTARSVANEIESHLAKGLIPKSLDAPASKRSDVTIGQAIREYLQAVSVSKLDQEVLDRVASSIGSTRLDNALDYAWSETWVRTLKVDNNLAPGTIRKRVGALARMLDWYLKREAERGGRPLANPLRLLPKNYSTYNEHERKLLAEKEGKSAKVDVARDRRLMEGEEARILAAMRGEKRPDRQRALDMPDGEALIDMFLLIANTGLRLREAYRLRVDDVRLSLRTLHIPRSKTGAARDVPILPDLYAMLERRASVAKHEGGMHAPVFPWWTGTDDDKELNRLTSRLSRAFGRVFAYAGCDGLTEHDLRHEATCRWVLMRDSEGRWLFRGEEVMKITGHKDPRTFMRYLSLRGSDLAERLWVTATPVLAA